MAESMLRSPCGHLVELPLRTVPPVCLGCQRPKGHGGEHMLTVHWDDAGQIRTQLAWVSWDGDPTTPARLVPHGAL